MFDRIDMKHLEDEIIKLIHAKNKHLLSHGEFIFIIAGNKTQYMRYIQVLQREKQDISRYRPVESWKELIALHPPTIKAFQAYEDAHLNPFWNSDLHLSKLKDIERYWS